MFDVHYAIPLSLHLHEGLLVTGVTERNEEERVTYYGELQ